MFPLDSPAAPLSARLIGRQSVCATRAHQTGPASRIKQVWVLKTDALSVRCRGCKSAPPPVTEILRLSGVE